MFRERWVSSGADRPANWLSGCQRSAGAYLYYIKSQLITCLLGTSYIEVNIPRYLMDWYIMTHTRASRPACTGSIPGIEREGNQDLAYGRTFSYSTLPLTHTLL